jgi:hypothetical protein
MCAQESRDNVNRALTNGLNLSSGLTGAALNLGLDLTGAALNLTGAALSLAQRTVQAVRPPAQSDLQQASKNRSFILIKGKV